MLGWENENGATFEASKTRLVHFSRKRAALDGGSGSKERTLREACSGGTEETAWTKARDGKTAVPGNGSSGDGLCITGLVDHAHVATHRTTSASPGYLCKGHHRSFQNSLPHDRGGRGPGGADRTTTARTTTRLLNKSHTLPTKHALWKLRRHATQQCRCLRPPLHHIVDEFRETDVENLERSVQEKDEAIATAGVSTHETLKTFTDASIRNGLSGIGAAFANGKPRSKKLVGRATNNHRAELIAVAKAVEKCNTSTSTAPVLKP
ncbi:hypothetical protein LIA77_00017 [Sarocladium implicatum]|nr:hypothetical protein LIA77_00017 [Sarocladium implicatum]